MKLPDIIFALVIGTLIFLIFDIRITFNASDNRIDPVNTIVHLEPINENEPCKYKVWLLDTEKMKWYYMSVFSNCPETKPHQTDSIPDFRDKEHMYIDTTGRVNRKRDIKII